VREIDHPPEVAVANAGAGAAALDVDARSGAARGPLWREDPLMVPLAAVEHELAELEEVARQEVDAAAHVGLVGRLERQVVAVDAERPGEQTIEEGRERLSGGGGEDRAGQVGLHAAVDGALARVADHVERERVAVPVRLLGLLLHAVLVAG
jgi:hypothetical protein